MVKTGNRERNAAMDHDSDRNGYRMGRQNEYQKNLENVCSFLMED